MTKIWQCQFPFRLRKLKNMFLNTGWFIMPNESIKWLIEISKEGSIKTNWDMLKKIVISEEYPT